MRRVGVGGGDDEVGQVGVETVGNGWQGSAWDVKTGVVKQGFGPEGVALGEAEAVAEVLGGGRIARGQRT